MLFESAQLSAQENYQLLVGGVTPRPIAWISSLSAAGVANLAPYSFFSVASCNPPVLSFTQVTPRDLKNKDTLTNLSETGECVVHIVNEALLEKMNLTSALLPSTESEFQFANIATCASQTVNVPSVADAPVRYECKLREIIQVSDLPMGGTLVLLDVKAVVVADSLLENGRINQAALESVGKMGGDWYALTSAQRELARP